jgi:hypothetical protein
MGNKVKALEGHISESNEASAFYSAMRLAFWPTDSQPHLSRGGVEWRHRDSVKIDR